MEIPSDFWLLFLANLPIVAVVLVALQRRWIVMGVTHFRELEGKDKEIEFREQLRQEAISDRASLQEKDKEKTEALRELTNVVKQTLELNDRLLNEELEQRWDGNDRRQRNTPRTSRGT